MRVMVNEECILCGLCVDLCPEVFELGDEFAFAKNRVIEEEHEECCLQAAEECPTSAIEIES
ncbi:MAG: ferredoxin [Dethiobacteria bacterium]